ncbi:hypothetical protein M413DRAFT_31387 [Hebeloma cylindrosporum]|uniref:BTB domain-containing protein n=1 Tax=Hebeloma cylindrosporum TaxID=76867 RepID=A0A0C2Y6V0_HEBCY|nr:hypothetical protein M413DRAFT_31387 [Hebeloma cylindrosporum h7]
MPTHKDKKMNVPYNYGAGALGSIAASADSPERADQVRASLHPNFDFELVVFQVGKTLFKVIKDAFLVPGTIFEAMFSLPGGGEVPVEGTSLECPIILEGVDEHHFQAFLRVLYPFVGLPKVVEYMDWVGVLQLATMWEFTEIREEAIAALAALNPQRELTEQISLGVQYGIIDWVRDGYRELVGAFKLTIEDLHPPFPISWETATKLFCARERLLSNNPWKYDCCEGTYGPFPISLNPRHCPCRTAAIVDEVFKADFEAMTNNPVSSGPPLPTS